jgi:prevent-host-death family protein
VYVKYETYKTYTRGMMIRLSASKARIDFADTINRVADCGERIVLHRRGKDLVAVVPMADLSALENLEDRRDIEAARRALSETHERIPYREARRELGLEK